MRYCIVNTMDKPCKRLVAQVIDGKCYYMIRAIKDCMKKYDGMDSFVATDIRDFGWDVEEKNGIAVFTRNWKECAKYQDGSHRQWQDDDDTFWYPLVNLEDEQ